VLLKSLLNLGHELLLAALADDDGLAGALHAARRGGDEVKSGLALAEGEANSVVLGEAAVPLRVEASGVSGLAAELHAVAALEVGVATTSDLPDKGGRHLQTEM